MSLLTIRHDILGKSRKIYARTMDRYMYDSGFEVDEIDIVTAFRASEMIILLIFPASCATGCAMTLSRAQN